MSQDAGSNSALLPGGGGVQPGGAQPPDVERPAQWGDVAAASAPDASRSAETIPAGQNSRDNSSRRAAVRKARARKGELRSRNTYYEIKVTSEEWWTLLFTAWVGISLFLITRAVLYNVKHGWHCPRNCDAFMTPFAVAIGTCVLPIFFCCPVLGAKGVWWVYIRRKKDDDAHRNHVRRQKKMCCIAISWIPTAQSKLFCFTRSRDTSKPLPDAAAYGDVQAPSWVTEGTEHAMDTNPGDPMLADMERSKKSPARDVASNVGKALSSSLKQARVRAPEMLRSQPLVEQAPQVDQERRQQGLRGEQQFFDVGQELAARPLTEQAAEHQTSVGVSARGRRRGNTMELVTGFASPAAAAPAQPTAASQAPGRARLEPTLNAAAAAARGGGAQPVEVGPMGTWDAGNVTSLMQRASVGSARPRSYTPERGGGAPPPRQHLSGGAASTSSLYGAVPSGGGLRPASSATSSYSRVAPPIGVAAGVGGGYSAGQGSSLLSGSGSSSAGTAGSTLSVQNKQSASVMMQKYRQLLEEKRNQASQRRL